jgi:hypothetical protein
MTLLRSVSARRSIRNCDDLDSLIAPERKWPFYRGRQLEWGNVTATKILWGQISIVFAVVLATMWLATQWTAWRLGFQSQLGPPWFEFAGVPVYVPVAFFWWWYHYDAYAPRIFLEGAGIAVSGGFAAIGIAIVMSVWRAREAKTITTYGSARWAYQAGDSSCRPGRRRHRAVHGCYGARSGRRSLRGLMIPQSSR